jgi:putative ABC transport system permease protein
MLKSYFVIAIRNLIRNKTFSVINILGLVMGFTFSLFIFLWVQDEWNTDRFHTNGERLFRVMQTQFYQDGQQQTSYRTPFLLADALKDAIPEISHATIVDEDQLILRKDQTMVSEAGIYASDDFWNMFSFQLLKGKSEAPLSSADQIVLSASLAKKLFGEEDPLGKPLYVDNRREYFVSGIFADVPNASSVKFDFILSSKDYQRFPWANDWSAIGTKTFIMLHPGARPEMINEKIKNFLKGRQAGNKDQLSIQPYEEMYLYANFKNGVQDGGRIEYVQLFGLVAALILLVACINFMNLSTAQSVKRSKEVGVRKVIGALRQQLIRQFTGEAILIVALAAMLALILVEGLLPDFNSLTGKQITLVYSAEFTFCLFALVFLTGVVAGSYPALFLSSLKPVTVLKGNLSFKPGATLVRKTLVTVQFVLSFLFITATIVIHQQMDYIQNKDLGFDRNDLVNVGMNNVAKNIDAIKNDLLQNPLIRSVTYSNQQALTMDRTTTWVDWSGNNPRQEVNFAFAGVGYDYLRTLGIELQAGRDFSAGVASDSMNVIVNEEAVKQMGLTDPLGHEMTTTRDLVRKGKIIGVVKDFHQQSMHTPILPLILFLDTSPKGAAVVIRTQHGRTKEAINHIEHIFKKYNPDDLFSYNLTTDKFRQQYASEVLLEKLSDAFSLLAIGISCLGLFGLVVFSAEQRIKEIGIRKVLGATLINIVGLLSKDFLKLIILAVVITIPLAIYLADSWLDHFVYHTELRWTVFAMGGCLLLIIALLTISVKSVRAAQANPVDSLRSD